MTIITYKNRKKQPITTYFFNPQALKNKRGKTIPNSRPNFR
ncbi:hypothetical protein ADICYQ_0886 [Cyclobacterium qasimii M12-11B]|uniref:Uncharacterized protein n=1 Tax=Cyclobacterium qasimii M12-11B TaxID=641524 RepID=S7VL20_9BACT|nr:hypothetical protein ADICYQ_0886 [Cyclobacterium qasimii M12-11B]